MYYADFMCSYWIWMIQCHFIILIIILLYFVIFRYDFVVFLAVLLLSFYL